MKSVFLCGLVNTRSCRHMKDEGRSPCIHSPGIKVVGFMCMLYSDWGFSYPDWVLSVLFPQL